MVKRCSYGTCNSDTRYPERLKDGVSFVPFPKPARNLEKCMRWIRLCGRPHEQLNLGILKERLRAKHIYVCTKHFEDGAPTLQNPDPKPACVSDNITPARAPPKNRSMTEPVKKRARIALTEVFRHDENQIIVHPHTPIEDSECAKEPETSDHEEKRECHLQMLALAAENESLKQQVARLIVQNENLLRSTVSNSSKREETVSSNKLLLSVDKLKQNTKKDEFVYYTGLNQEQFTCLFKFLVPVDEPFIKTKNLTAFKQLKMEDQLLMVLMKLRQNFDFTHIGRLFGISQQDASTVFTNWIQFMFYRCGSVPIWPHRDIIISKMPNKFREEFPNTLVIIDGTEIKIQRPSSMTRQSQCYSDYKSCNTLKGLVGIDPRGSIIFLVSLIS